MQRHCISLAPVLPSTTESPTPAGLTTEILGIYIASCIYLRTTLHTSHSYMCKHSADPFLLPSPPTSVVIIVCSVLGVVFLVLAVAAVALIVYIFTFTRTETIAHRRLRTENQPVSYRCVHGGGACVMNMHSSSAYDDRPTLCPSDASRALGHTATIPCLVPQRAGATPPSQNHPRVGGPTRWLHAALHWRPSR